MGHVERLGSTKFRHHSRCDELVFQQMNAAVDHPMADGGDGFGAEALANVTGNRFGSHLMRVASDGVSIFFPCFNTFGDELRIGIADAFHLTIEDSFR